MKRRDRVLEFVGQAGRHLTKALKIVLQRHLLAQLSDFRDVSQKAKCAARAAIGGEVDRRDCSAEPPRHLFRRQRFNLFAAVDFSALETVGDHFSKPGKLVEDRVNRLAERAAVDIKQRAAGSVDYHHSSRAVESDERRRDAGDDAFAESLGRVGPLARLMAQLFERCSLLLKLCDHRLKCFEDKLSLIARLWSRRFN